MNFPWRELKVCLSMKQVPDCHFVCFVETETLCCFDDSQPFVVSADTRIASAAFVVCSLHADAKTARQGKPERKYRASDASNGRFWRDLGCELEVARSVEAKSVDFRPLEIEKHRGNLVRARPQAVKRAS